MFIELAEFLRCPEDHEEQSFCVIVPDSLVDREVSSGVVGCPVCKQEYPIVGGAAVFDELSPDDLRLAVPEPPRPAPETIQALLGLTGPGGYIVLAGSATLVAKPLSALLQGIHVITVNPPEPVRSAAASSLYCRRRIPLRDSMARGVVLGAEIAGQHWLQEGARVLLGGLRLVVMKEDVTIDGVGRLAVGDGMWVGRKEQGGGR